MRHNYFREKPESQMENTASAQHYLGDVLLYYQGESKRAPPLPQLASLISHTCN